MFFWIFEMKKRVNFDWFVLVRLIDLILNELQYFMYKIVKDYFIVSNENFKGKFLFLFVKGIVGFGKSYVIDALRNLF